MTGHPGNWARTRKCLLLSMVTAGYADKDSLLVILLECLPTYMCMYHKHAWCLWRLEEGILSFGTGYANSSKLFRGSGDQIKNLWKAKESITF